MRVRVCLLAMCMAATVSAQQRPAPSTPRLISRIEVIGERASPPIWELQRGDETLWILGTLYPVPRNIPVDPAAIDRRIAQSQVVIGLPGLSLGEEIGFFRGLFLIPSLRKSQYNPDRKTLRDVLPPAVYARWSKARARWLDDDEDMDRLRPINASWELWQAALGDSGLLPIRSLDVKKTAKRLDVPVLDARLKVSFPSPKKSIKKYNSEQLADVQCLVETLDRVDTDLPNMRPRAEAWSVGDVAHLRALPFHDQAPACIAALGSSEVAQERGIHDLQGQLRARWLEETRKAFASNDRVFASLPVQMLMDDNGVLQALQREGFVVVPREAPEDLSPATR